MKFKDVEDNLNILKLDKMASCLSEYVDKINSEKIPFLNALYELTKLEIANKAERSSQFNIRVAHFPYYRTFEEYENYSTIVTSNQQFSKWGEVLSDSTLASAILDRLLHHSYVFNITGNSYRIKDKILEKRENNVY